MNIVFIGKPGSGKGTAAIKLANELGYKLLSTGDMLRSEKSSGSELGNRVKHLIDTGNLIPDSIINEVILSEVKKPIPIGKFHILDGYPRTEHQANFLDAILNIGIVFYLDVSDEIISKRIIERGKLSGRADDQDESIIKTTYNKILFR